jgi:hypothetical protein
MTRERQARYVLLFAIVLCFARYGGAQRITRPDPADSAHPFDTPPAVAGPVSDGQLARWREQAKAALFLPRTMPPVAARDFGSFTPMRNVVAHRVTYGLSSACGSPQSSIVRIIATESYPLSSSSRGMGAASQPGTRSTLGFSTQALVRSWSPSIQSGRKSVTRNISLTPALMTPCWLDWSRRHGWAG